MAANLPKLVLYTSQRSPYCMKVTLLAQELGLLDHVTLDYSAPVHPTQTSTTHSHVAPIGKIPVLMVDDKPLYASETICQYLDSIGGGKALPPPGSFARFEALTTEALATGIIDAALLLRYERSGADVDRPAELQWPAWIEGQLSKVTRAIPILAQRTLPDPEGEVLGLDGIAAAVALWYADLRAKDANWRELEGGAKLNEWLLKVQQRKSWKETPFIK